MKSIPFFLLFFLGSVFSGRAQSQFADAGPCAQNNYSTVLDGAFPKDHIQQRMAVPKAYIREADAMWARRVWRKMILKEKMNHALYFPIERIQDRRSLTQVLVDAICEGSLTAYDPISDEFTNIMSRASIMNMLYRIDTVFVENPDPPYNLEAKIIKTEFDPARVKEYRIKEDWVFDRERSVMEVRIIGLCPVAENIDPSTGEIRGTTPLFWVYFPEARNIFANVEVHNKHNRAEQRSLDDIFQKRYFASYIYKVQNPYDRSISEYKSGINALLEGEAIKEDIFAFEEDLWER